MLSGQSHSSWIRSIVSLIAVVFLLPHINWAFDNALYQGHSLAISHAGKSISIPKHLGHITQSFQGRSKTIIHIQDLHCHYEVQKNISGLIQHFAVKHDLKLVGEEGAFDTVNLSQIREFPIDKIREEVSDYFVKQGRLTGAEYYSATGKSKIQLEGIETPELYSSSEKLIRSFLNHESLGICLDLRDQLENLKAYLYNPALMNVDKDKQAYREGKLDVLGYATRLKNHAKYHGFNLDPYPSMKQYLQRGPASSQADQLFQEMDQLDQIIRENLYTTKHQQDLDVFCKRLDIIEKLLNISATQEEVQAFHRNRDQYLTQAFIDFFHQLRAYDQTPLQADFEFMQLDQYLNQIETFYQLVDQRSQHFIGNLTAKMDKAQQDLAVMITGGFHTDAILSELRQQNIGYISVQPRLTKQDLVNPYFSLLQGKLLPIEELLAKNQTAMALRAWPETPYYASVVALTFATLAEVLGEKLNLKEQYKLDRYNADNLHIVDLQSMTNVSLENLGIAPSDQYKVCQAKTTEGSRLPLLIANTKMFTKETKQFGRYIHFGDIGFIVFDEQRWDLVNKASQVMQVKDLSEHRFWPTIIMDLREQINSSWKAISQLLMPPITMVTDAIGIPIMASVENRNDSISGGGRTRTSAAMQALVPFVSAMAFRNLTIGEFDAAHISELAMKNENEFRQTERGAIKLSMFLMKKSTYVFSIEYDNLVIGEGIIDLFSEERNVIFRFQIFPEFRSQGYGTQVVDCLKAYFGNNDFNSIFLKSITVNAQHFTNSEKSFFKNQGFIESESDLMTLMLPMSDPKEYKSPEQLGKGTSRIWYTIHNWVRDNIYDRNPLTWETYQEVAHRVENHYLWGIIGSIITLTSIGGLVWSLGTDDYSFLLITAKQLIGMEMFGWVKAVSLSSWLVFFVGSHLNINWLQAFLGKLFNNGEPIKKTPTANLKAVGLIFLGITLSHLLPLGLIVVASYLIHRIVNRLGIYKHRELKIKAESQVEYQSNKKNDGLKAQMDELEKKIRKSWFLLLFRRSLVLQYIDLVREYTEILEKKADNIDIVEGTIIEDGVEIIGNVWITGKNVKISKGTKLNNLTITGDNVTIGQNNKIEGLTISQNNIKIGEGNTFKGSAILADPDLAGSENKEANLSIGNNNLFGSYKIYNNTGELIKIGDHNSFADGSVMRSMIRGWIWIGHHNTIGLDGKGVISTSYDFGNKYCGPVIIGRGLDTKRGAELLGFSAYGFTPEQVYSALDISEDELLGKLEEIFRGGRPDKVEQFLETLRDNVILSTSAPSNRTVMLVGAVKPKYSIILGDEERTSEIRDGTRIQHSVIGAGVDIGESFKLYFTTVLPESAMSVLLSNLFVGNQIGNDIIPSNSGYPKNEDWGDYFKNKNISASRFLGQGTSRIWYTIHNWVRDNIYDRNPLTWEAYQKIAHRIENHYIWGIIGIIITLTSIGGLVWSLVTGDYSFLVNTAKQLIGLEMFGWVKAVSMSSWLVFFVGLHLTRGSPNWQANFWTSVKIFLLVTFVHLMLLWFVIPLSYSIHQLTNNKTLNHKNSLKVIIDEIVTLRNWLVNILTYLIQQTKKNLLRSTDEKVDLELFPEVSSFITAKKYLINYLSEEIRSNKNYSKVENEAAYKALGDQAQDLTRLIKDSETRNDKNRLEELYKRQERLFLGGYPLEIETEEGRLTYQVPSLDMQNIVDQSSVNSEFYNWLELVTKMHDLGADSKIKVTFISDYPMIDKQYLTNDRREQLGKHYNATIDIISKSELAKKNEGTIREPAKFTVEQAVELLKVVDPDFIDTYSEDFENSQEAVERILKYKDIQKIAIVGYGLRNWIWLLALVGKEVTFIDMANAPNREVKWKVDKINKQLEAAGLNRVIHIKNINKNLNDVLPDDMTTKADLFTCFDLVGPNLRGEPDKMLENIKSNIRPNGYFLVDVRANSWGDDFISHLKGTFPDMTLAEHGHWKGGYDLNDPMNYLYQLNQEKPHQTIDISGLSEIARTVSLESEEDAMNSSLSDDVEKNTLLESSINLLRVLLLSLLKISLPKDSQVFDEQQLKDEAGAVDNSYQSLINLLDKGMLNYFKHDPFIFPSLPKRESQQYNVIFKDIGLFKFIINLFFGKYLDLSKPTVYLPKSLAGPYINKADEQSVTAMLVHQISAQLISWIILKSAQQRFAPSIWDRMIERLKALLGKPQARWYRLTYLALYARNQSIVQVANELIIKLFNEPAMMKLSPSRFLFKSYQLLILSASNGDLANERLIARLTLLSRFQFWRFETQKVILPDGKRQLVLPMPLDKNQKQLILYHLNQLGIKIMDQPINDPRQRLLNKVRNSA